MTARLAVLYLLLAVTAHANVITDENKRAGTDQWQLANNPSDDITGYASATSVAAGETLRFHVSTPDPKFAIEVFRMGWYGGTGGRRMTDAVVRDGGAQPVPAPDSKTGIVRCKWRESHSIVIPSNWLSGVYLAKLTAKPSGKQNWIIFVVRDNRRADLVFQSSVTTDQAYNKWGGKSLYGRQQAAKVSFDRPYNATNGPGGFLFRWEYNMVRFLEREGYDVTYITNIDTHARGETLLRAKAFLSVGHDEYWSWEMRRNVTAARDAGVHLAFFSANTCYWQVRFEDDLRTMVAYKEFAEIADPFALDKDPSNDHLVTTKWRLAPVKRPEEELIGVMYDESPIDGDIVIDNPSHWVFANTKLAKGDVLKGLLGYEVDSIQSVASPPGVVRLAHSPYVSKQHEKGFADMAIYEAKSGAIVFATGSIQWSWGLDDFNAAARGKRSSEAAKQITRNVLDRMTGRHAARNAGVPAG